jgi:decaprenyl-phosphate phosphoribosyltransferase
MKSICYASLLALRPKQWIKNLLLFVAPFAAGVGFIPKLHDLILGFIVFCLASSFGYIINDLNDFEIDKMHPKKKHRPFASGALSFKQGIVILVALFLLVIFLGQDLQDKFKLIIVLYVLNTFIYSKLLKRIPVIELFVVAFGFVLRLLAGALVINLPLSEWFLIVGGFGALFVVSSKRLAEFRLKESQVVRQVINMYTFNFLHSVMTTSVAVCITAYTFWAFSQPINPFWFQLSIIPFVMGFFRLKWISEFDGIELPEEAILGDKPLLMLSLCSFILLSAGIY